MRLVKRGPTRGSSVHLGTTAPFIGILSQDAVYYTRVLKLERPRALYACVYERPLGLIPSPLQSSKASNIVTKCRLFP